MTTKTAAPRLVAPDTVAAPAPATVDAATAALALTAWIAAAALAFPRLLPVIRSVVLALICPRPVNVLLVGLPGTAKTGVLTAITAALALDRPLFRSLSEWTDADDLLGPADPRSFGPTGDGTIRRLSTAPTLGSAGFVFLDEVGRLGKGSANLILPALSDRRLPDGTPVPAHAVAAASNTSLADGDDRALADRFTLRPPVEVIGGDDLYAVMTQQYPVDGNAPAVVALPAVPAGAVDVLRARAAAVTLPSYVVRAVVRVVDTLRGPAPAGQRHPYVSPRRAVASLAVLQASAALAGRDVVTWADVTDVLPLAFVDEADAARPVAAAITAALPSWIANLDRVRRATDDAVALARRAADGEALDGAALAAHRNRKANLDAAADTLRGTDGHAEAERLVATALAACARLDVDVKRAAAARAAAEAAAEEAALAAEEARLAATTR